LRKRAGEDEVEKVFKDTASLDQKCENEFFLTDEILMENAGSAVSNYVRKNFQKGSSVVIVSGSGHNGADGVVVARQLYGDFSVKLYLSAPPKSEIARNQLKRALAVGVERIYKIEDGDIIVDALFGIGFRLPPSEKTSALFREVNSLKGFKIACDIPSGLDVNGNIGESAVKCNYTVTMGAMKLALLSDKAKDLSGRVKVANLGISREIYEGKKFFYNLEESDLTPPYRTEQGTHKGDYGHVAVLSGEKEGASTLSALAAYNFGAGLVTLVSKIKRDIPYELMQGRDIPVNSSVIVAGMGLGQIGINNFREAILNSSLPLVLDADVLYEKSILELLSIRPLDIVLTPHPKEFSSLLSILFHMELSVDEVVKRRIELVEMFAEKYPNVVLLLKGANRVIAGEGSIYFDTLGNQNLAKGGSGDVLAGMIGALISQGYSPLKATISASLAHSKASQLYKGNNFSFSPIKLIDELSNL
jgi:hydroxyethylthiazole kinase-like uncharacterized protein yjeF